MRTAAINPACQRCGLCATQYCVLSASEPDVGGCVDYPAECAACSAHTCACLAANDSNWASYTSCTDEDGGWVEGVGP